MGRLMEKVAIITGAASGIGYATAKLMASEGAKVMAADINLELAQKLADEIRALGGEAVAVYTDVSNEESVKELISKTEERFSKIDVLFNNAGATKKEDRTVGAMELDVWDYAIGVNLTSVMLGCKYAIPIMLENKGGSIVNTVSVEGLYGDLSTSAYAAAKAGAMSLTRSVAIQYGKQSIRCNAIAPGIIDTPAAKDRIPKELWGIFESHTALPRNGNPMDVGYAAVFLASDESSFITGQTITVDGGFTGHVPTFSDFMKLVQAYKKQSL